MELLTLCGLSVALVLIYVVVVGLVAFTVKSRRAIWIGCISHGVQILLAMTLFGFPRGRGIRPMGLAGLLFLVAMTAFFVGIPLTVWELRKGGATAGWIAFVLNITPLLTGYLAMYVVASLWGLVIED